MKMTPESIMRATLRHVTVTTRTCQYDLSLTGHHSRRRWWWWRWWWLMDIAATCITSTAPMHVSAQQTHTTGQCTRSGFVQKWLNFRVSFIHDNIIVKANAPLQEFIMISKNVQSSYTLNMQVSCLIQNLNKTPVFNLYNFATPTQSCQDHLRDHLPDGALRLMQDGHSDNQSLQI